MMMEENEAMMTSTKQGYSPAKEHFPHVYRISIGLLKEITSREETNDNSNVQVHEAAIANHQANL